MTDLGREWTVEDLYRLPPDGRSYEIQQGLLLAEPLPGTRHGRLLSAIDLALSVYVRERRLGVVVVGDTGLSGVPAASRTSRPRLHRRIGRRRHPAGILADG